MVGKDPSAPHAGGHGLVVRMKQAHSGATMMKDSEQRALVHHPLVGPKASSKRIDFAWDVVPCTGTELESST